MISDKPTSSIPHREPFIWIHRLMERNDEGSEGVVEYDVREDLDLFRGHFPNNPIFPGVIQVEAAAQACCFVNNGVLNDGEKPSKEAFFVAIDSYKFKRPVVPPCTLRFEVKRLNVRAGLERWEVAVMQQDQKMSGGIFWLKNGPVEKVAK